MKEDFFISILTQVENETLSNILYKSSVIAVFFFSKIEKKEERSLPKETNAFTAIKKKKKKQDILTGIFK